MKKKKFLIPWRFCSWAHCGEMWNSTTVLFSAHFKAIRWFNRLRYQLACSPFTWSSFKLIWQVWDNEFWLNSFVTINLTNFNAYFNITPVPWSLPSIRFSIIAGCREEMESPRRLPGIPVIFWCYSDANIYSFSFSISRTFVCCLKLKYVHLWRCLARTFKTESGAITNVSTLRGEITD